MTYLIHPDHQHYKTFVFNHKAVRNALGSETQFHFARAPQPYKEGWQPFDIGFEALSKKAAQPDIMVRNGRLFLTEAALAAVAPLIEPHGELLPITYEGQPGLLLNILATAEQVNGLNTEGSHKNAFGDVQALAFNETAVQGLGVFRTVFDGYMGVYCNAAFKAAVEGAALKGLVFSDDLGTVFPPDSAAQQPPQH